MSPLTKHIWALGQVIEIVCQNATLWLKFKVALN